MIYFAFHHCVMVLLSIELRPFSQSKKLLVENYAGIAQMVEQLTCNQ